MEVEAKFDVPDGTIFDRLLAVETLAGLTAGPVTVKRVQDRYLDTADHAFLRGGFVCRVRQSDGARLVTLKGLGGVEGDTHSRPELEVMVGPDADAQIEAWPPGEARLLGLELSGGRPLHPLIEIWQERHQRVLQAADGREAVELSLDRVWLDGTGDQPRLELEAELLSTGTVADLQALITLLKSEWGLAPQPLSKLEQGLALRDPDLFAHYRRSTVTGSGPGVQVDDHVAEACRKILRFQFEIMLANELGSRRGEDIVFVHDMRVATRRMRASIRLLGSYFERKPLKGFAKELRNIGRALGNVRDLDVFEDKARRDYLAHLSTGHDHELDSLFAHWHAEREQARAALIDLLDSPRYQAFVASFYAFVREPGAGVPPVSTDKPERVQVRHMLGSMVWQLYETVRAYEVLLGDAPVKTLHALRIDCKRLRYVLEFFREVLGPETQGLITAIKRVQDHLGDLQDAVVATALLGEWELRLAAEPPGHEVEQEGVGAYRGFRAEEVERLIARFPDTWQTIVDVDFRRRLAAALAVL